MAPNTMSTGVLGLCAMLKQLLWFESKSGWSAVGKCEWEYKYVRAWRGTDLIRLKPSANDPLTG